MASANRRNYWKLAATRDPLPAELITAKNLEPISPGSFAGDSPLFDDFADQIRDGIVTIAPQPSASEILDIHD